MTFEDKLHEPSDSRYSCGCMSCDSIREKAVKVGNLCRPATRDPKVLSPGTTPFWLPGSWQSAGWSSRMENFGIDLITVIGEIDRNDSSNGGHLNAVICFSPKAGEIVTAKKWLVVVSSVVSPWHSY